MRNFKPKFEELPERLGLFPLPNVLLLPGQILPLNIFEERYIRLFEEAMGQGRMVGLIQPRQASEDEVRSQVVSEEAPLYDMGGMGRIIQFQETDDGRFSVQLLGVCRFSLNEEVLTDFGYRDGIVSWDGFQQDLEDVTIVDMDMDRFHDILGRYFRKTGMSLDTKMLAEAPVARLINGLAMVCPFGPAERQALLEVETLQGRGEMLLTLIEMAVHDGDEDTGSA